MKETPIPRLPFQRLPLRFITRAILEFTNEIPPEYTQGKLTQGMASYMFRRILDEISEHGQITDSKELRYFINIANEIKTEYKVDNGELVKGYALGPHWGLYPEWVAGLAVLLVQFLTEIDIRKIEICRSCGDYFFKNRKDKKYCSEKCRKDYNNREAIESGELANYLKKHRPKGHYIKVKDR